MKSTPLYGINNNFYFVDLASLPYDQAYIHIDVECNVYRRRVYTIWKYWLDYNLIICQKAMHSLLPGHDQ